MSNRQARRQPPRTDKRLGLPKTNLLALRDVQEYHFKEAAGRLTLDALALEAFVNRQDRRSHSIIRQMRRVASFYQQVMEERGWNRK